VRRIVALEREWSNGPFRPEKKGAGLKRRMIGLGREILAALAWEKVWKRKGAGSFIRPNSEEKSADPWNRVVEHDEQGDGVGA